MRRREFLSMLAAVPAMEFDSLTTEVWTKTTTPILTATQAWEEGAVYQPCVRLDGTKWKMLYSGGWAHPGIGYAECSGDPRIAANWIKHTGAIWGGVDFNQVLTINGSDYLFTSYQDKVYAVRLPQWNAPDFGSACPIIFQGATTADFHQVAPSPFIGNDGKLNVAYVSADQAYTGWKQYLAKSADGVMFVKDGRGALTSLQLGTGSYGITGNIQKVGAKFQCWQHNAPVGSTPTDIYHWESVDGFAWSVRNGGIPVVTRTLPWEIAGEQVADAFVTEANGTSWMFYDATNNAAPSACIGVAKYGGPLLDICS